jgi:hypothetical protein
MARELVSSPILIIIIRYGRDDAGQVVSTVVFAFESLYMFAPTSIFLDFNLPNSTTWFYFSLLLAIALFFKFGRLFTIRNLDVLMLFLLVPPIMIIQSSTPKLAEQPALPAAALIGQAASGGIPSLLSNVEMFTVERQTAAESARWLWLGYVGLLIGSGIFFVRCLFDLALVQRPILAPNLTFGGLGWFGLALIVCLSAVAFRERPGAAYKHEGIPNPQRKTGPDSAPMSEARRLADPYVTQEMIRGLAVAGQLAVVLGLILMGWLHYQDATAGLAAAVFYLLLPYTGMFVREVDHVWPMAIIVWALVAYRRPAVTGFVLGLSAAPFYYPVVLAPVLTSFYWGRGAGRFLFFFFVSVALVMGGVALASDSVGDFRESIRRALDLAAWQPWKTPPADMEGFWTGVHAAYRIPVFIAYAAFVVATAFWPMPKNLGHVLALSSAVLIGTQFWYADQGGIYVLWYLPLLLMMTFRPNLEDRRPAVIQPETDWICRGRSLLARPFRRLFRKPQLTKAA